MREIVSAAEVGRDRGREGVFDQYAVQPGADAEAFSEDTTSTWR